MKKELTVYTIYRERGEAKTRRIPRNLDELLTHMDRAECDIIHRLYDGEEALRELAKHRCTAWLSQTLTSTILQYEVVYLDAEVFEVDEDGDMDWQDTKWSEFADYVEPEERDEEDC
jgi:hypothetical protein